MKEYSAIVQGYTHLSYRYKTGSGTRDFEADSMTEIVVTIEATFPDPRDNTKSFDVCLGTLKAVRVHVVDALEEGVDLFDLFDTIQEAHDASVDLFDESYSDFAPQILEEFEDTWFCQDILLIQEITVKPFAWGQRVGVSALYRFMKDHMADCSFVVLKPYPLQVSEAYKDPDRRVPLALDRFTQDESKATRKLEQVYGTLGFMKFDGSSHMVLPAFFEQGESIKGLCRNTVSVPQDILLGMLS